MRIECQSGRNAKEIDCKIFAITEQDSYFGRLDGGSEYTIYIENLDGIVGGIGYYF